MQFFVCDKCGCLDTIALAYPSSDFTSGPPASWKCTHCQGKPWHKQFPRHFWNGQTPVVNRALPGPTISMG